MYMHQFTGVNSDLYSFIEVASPPLTGADSSSGQLQVKSIEHEVLKTSSVVLCSCDVYIYVYV